MRSASLYFSIFGKLLGAPMGPAAEISYLEFIVPDLIMMNILKPLPNDWRLPQFVAQMTRSHYHYFQHGRAEQDFGYSPRISLEQGLRSIAEVTL
jgi:nucleoside-diphosphate-sugar epimerase